MAGGGLNFELQGKKIAFAHPHRWKLRHHPVLRRGKKVMIIILDGWGEQIPDEYNGIHVALTPTMDALKKVVFGCPCSSVKITPCAPCWRNASSWRFSVLQSDIG